MLEQEYGAGKKIRFYLLLRSPLRSVFFIGLGHNLECRRRVRRSEVPFCHIMSLIGAKNVHAYIQGINDIKLQIFYVSK